MSTGVDHRSRYRFVIGTILISLQVFVGMMWIGPAPLFTTMMAEYGVDRATVGLTTAAVSLIMAVFAIPAGIFASRIGLKRCFTIGAFLLSSGILTPFADNIVQLLATRVMFAIGCAMTFPVISGLVLQWFRRDEIAMFNGLNASAPSAGNAIAFLATVSIADVLGWKKTLALYSLFIFLAAITWLFLGKERPTTKAAPGGRDMAEKVSINSAFKMKATYLLGLAMAGPCLVFMAIGSWLATYYNEVFGMPLTQATSITALFTLFSIPACIIGGILPMRTGVRKPFLVIPGALLGFAALGTFLTNNMVIIYFSVAVFGVCVMIYMPAWMTLAMELPGMSSRLIPVVIGAALTIGNFAGFLGPLIVGKLTDTTGSYLPGLVICSVFSWSLLAAGLLLPETGRIRKSKSDRPV